MHLEDMLTYASTNCKLFQLQTILEGMHTLIFNLSVC